MSTPFSSVSMPSNRSQTNPRKRGIAMMADWALPLERANATQDELIQTEASRLGLGVVGPKTNLDPAQGSKLFLCAFSTA